MFTFATAAAALTLMAPPQSYAPPQDGPQRVAPRGSFARSCSGAYVNQGRLYADCRDTRGNVRGTSIELARCSDSDIGNDNGRLICFNHRGQFEGGRGDYDRDNRGGGWGDNRGGGWGDSRGGGGGSITVYRDANFRGDSQTFRREVANLSNSGFNDAISSMEFRGEWEACTDAYFRGQCQTFRDNVRNLNRWGMNDRISSLRPVRRGGYGY